MGTIDVGTEFHISALPVSGWSVSLRPPTGAEDLLLLEMADDDTAMAHALIARLVTWVETKESGSGPGDWNDLTPTDVDVLILQLRKIVLGDRVQAEVPCRAETCGKMIDISFGIDRYIAHHVPGDLSRRLRGWSIEPAGEPGWFCLSRRKGDDSEGSLVADAAQNSESGSDRDGLGEQEMRFRVPTIADQLAVSGRSNGIDELARRCIRPPGLSARQRRKAEAAMETLAPSLASELLGVCPECGAQVKVFFNARRYCLRELRDRAAFIYQDVDILARRYHWKESDILALPRNRRRNYAELARQAVES